jgi:Arc/MetJ family transcription regulator
MSTMSRTNIEIDDELIQRVMQVHGCRTMREAVDFALRKALGDPMTLEEALAMRGRGWGGDLEEMRAADRRRDEHLERLRNS